MPLAAEPFAGPALERLNADATVEPGAVGHHPRPGSNRVGAGLPIRVSRLGAATSVGLGGQPVLAGPRVGPRSAAEQVALDFAARGLRQLVEEVNLARVGVRC